MKRVRYNDSAQRDLGRHANMAPRVFRAMREYATGDGSYSNRVKQLKGTNTLRLPIGDFRILFIETADEIAVIKVAPRGDASD